MGAGKYGHVSGKYASDGNISYTGPGDEHPRELPSLLPLVNGCVVCIDKAVSIYSLHGASVTVIEGSPFTDEVANVMILHEGVNFGAPGRGFTITSTSMDGSHFGVLMAQSDPTGFSNLGIHLKSNISIAGNVDLRDRTGFSFQGRPYSDSVCPVDDCVATATITFSQNQSFNNSFAAFDMTQGLFRTGYVVVQNNYALGAGTGFQVPGGSQISFSNAGQDSSRISLTGNVAERNALGFYTLAPGDVIGNTAADNYAGGFYVIAGRANFQNNTAVGNGAPGLLLQFFRNDLTTPPSTVSFKSFTQNNFYGNDRDRPPLTVPVSQFPETTRDPGPSAHCGILNMGILPFYSDEVGNPVIPVAFNANGNFWGSTRGPSATGAADAVGGPCDQNGATTTVTSYASAGFAITTH